MRTILTAAAALGCLMLGACGTTGMTSGYSDNPSDWIAVTQHPDVNGGVIPPEAHAKAMSLGHSCNRQIEAQAAGPIKSGVGGAIVYGTGGIIGGYAGAAAGFGSAVSAKDYGFYNGPPMAISGGLNGLQTGSYSMSNAKGGCTINFFELSKEQQKAMGNGADWSGTFLQTMSAGPRAGGAKPPALHGAPSQRR